MSEESLRKISAWISIIGATMITMTFVILPAIGMLAIPLYADHGPLMSALIRILFFCSPMLSGFGGLFVLGGSPHIGGLMILVAGIGMFIAWWGQIGYIFCPLFAVTGATVLLAPKLARKT